MGKNTVKGLILLLVLCSPALGLAAPTINSISGSTADGQTVAISGNGFGSHSLKIEWLGGPTGNIEQGANGAAFSKSGWIPDGDTAGACQAPRYSTVRAHSGSKSISSFYLSNTYNSGYYYNFGGGQSSIYMTYWVYFDWAGSTAGQWKMWRISDGGAGGIYSDATAHVMSSQWTNSDGSYSMIYYCWWTPDQQTQYIGTGVARNRWVRVEVYYAQGPGGVFRYYIHNQDGAPFEAANRTNFTARATPVQYPVIQNYVGNISGGDRSQVHVYNDDIYLQAGTQARIEIGDKSTWSACAHREIQFPISWSDASVNFAFNRGSFVNGNTVYLYVVDSNGSINSTGYPVTIGGSPGPDVQPPAIPTNLRLEGGTIK